MWVWQRVVQRRSLHKQIGSRDITLNPPLFSNRNKNEWYAYTWWTNSYSANVGQSLRMSFWGVSWFNSISMPTQFQFGSPFNSWLFSSPYAKKYHVLRFFLGDLGGSWRHNLQFPLPWASPKINDECMTQWPNLCIWNSGFYYSRTLILLVLSRLNDWTVEHWGQRAVTLKSAKLYGWEAGVLLSRNYRIGIWQHLISEPSFSVGFWNPSSGRCITTKSPPVCFLPHLLSFL